MNNIWQQIQAWSVELGFQQIGISDIQLSVEEKRLQRWLMKKFHGDMEWMARHGSKRSRPAELVPSTLSVLSVRMNYLPFETHSPEAVLNHPELGYISRYALGRDYHKVMRHRLQQLAKRMHDEIGELSYRVFVDSAPVLEKPIAVKAGLGWQGKHTNVLNRNAGSWFFLGEIYTDLPLSKMVGAEGFDNTNHCGQCQACIDVCPTQAIIAPYELDARKCISYLTIEYKGIIPIEYRPLIGNRIYGCDDCQLICPWNRFAQTSEEADFAIRHQLDTPYLIDLFAWSEDEFLTKMEGSPIRRIGYECWQRNIAIALGNAPASRVIYQQLEKRLETASELVKPHIIWAMEHQDSVNEVCQ